jgi:1-acyl-sn-glycerol-3-phosphate acyltransferase
VSSSAGSGDARDVDRDQRWSATLGLFPLGLSIGEPTLVQLLVRFVLGPIARALYRPVVRGIEDVPRQGAVILALNHRAALDTAVVALITPRAVRFLGKAEYFTGRGLKGWLMKATFGTPLDFSRYEGMESSPAIRRAVTDEIMYALMNLTGLEYVDHYHKPPSSQRTA